MVADSHATQKIGSVGPCNMNNNVFQTGLCRPVWITNYTFDVEDNSPAYFLFYWNNSQARWQGLTGESRPSAVLFSIRLLCFSTLLCISLFADSLILEWLSRWEKWRINYVATQSELQRKLRTASVPCELALPTFYLGGNTFFFYLH